MKHVILAFSVLFCAHFQATAQTYRSAVGAKFGEFTSLSYLTFLKESNALEVFGGVRSFRAGSAMHFHASYQTYRKIQTVPQLRWYTGIGGAMFMYNYHQEKHQTTLGTLGIGPEAYIGLEYRVKDFPITISADLMGRYLLNGYYSGLNIGFGATTIRYIL